MRKLPKAPVLPIESFSLVACYHTIEHELYKRKMVTRVGIFSFDPKQVLGEGSFGRVYRGLYSGSFQEKTVAVKRILKRHDVHESVILQEVELMKRAEDHQNILHVITTSTNDDFLYMMTIC